MTDTSDDGSLLPRVGPYEPRHVLEQRPVGSVRDDGALLRARDLIRQRMNEMRREATR